MYIVMSDSDPAVAANQLYPADKYEMVQSIVELAERALGLGSSSFIQDEVHLNHWLWGDSIAAVCVFGMMITENLPKRNNMNMLIPKLEHCMKAAVEDIEQYDTPWPLWISDKRFINSQRGYLKLRHPEWYKQFDWYDKVKPHPVPVYGVAYNEE